MPRGDIQFLFGQFVPQCRHDIGKHFDDYCTIQFMAAGAVELRIDETAYALHGRWFWSAYPGPRVSFRAAGRRPWVHRYLAFNGKLVEQWRRDGLFPIAPQEAPLNVDYAERFDTMLDASRRTDRLSVRRATLLLETTLVELAEARAKPAIEPEWFKATRAQLELPGGEAIDYDAIANEAGLPLRTFRRRFTQLAGASPHEYHLAARVGQAKELLGATDVPIKQIAMQLGYRDVGFFSRQFAQLAGVPPGAYRRSRER